MSNPAWLRLPAALLLVVLLGGCAGGDEDADTLVVDERTLDLAKWNAAHRRVRDVCRRH